MAGPLDTWEIERGAWDIVLERDMALRCEDFTVTHKRKPYKFHIAITDSGMIIVRFNDDDRPHTEPIFQWKP